MVNLRAINESVSQCIKVPHLTLFLWLSIRLNYEWATIFFKLKDRELFKELLKMQFNYICL